MSEAADQWLAEYREYESTEERFREIADAEVKLTKAYDTCHREAAERAGISPDTLEVDPGSPTKDSDLAVAVMQQVVAAVRNGLPPTPDALFHLARYFNRYLSANAAFPNLDDAFGLVSRGRAGNPPKQLERSANYDAAFSRIDQLNGFREYLEQNADSDGALPRFQGRVSIEEAAAKAHDELKKEVDLPPDADTLARYYKDRTAKILASLIAIN